MNIRSLTVGASLPQDESDRTDLLNKLGAFARTGRAALEAAAFTVQTTRLSTQPLERWAASGERASASVVGVAEASHAAGFDYCSLGTIQAASIPDDPAISAAAGLTG